MTTKACQGLIYSLIMALLIACATPTAPKSRTGRDGPQTPYASEADEAGSLERTVDFSPDGKGKKDSEKQAKLPALPSPSSQIQAGLLSASFQPKPEPPALVSKDRQKIILNFEKADVAEVSNQIFGDYLKLSYVMDPKLQGRISMYLEGEFSKEELLQMVSKVYEANDIAIVPRSGVYYVQPAQRSTSSSLSIATPQMLRDEKGVTPVIVMYRLKYMDVKQATNTIKFFLSPGRQVIADAGTNAVIFVEGTENARTIVEVLKALDVNVLQEVNMEIVPLKSISPQDAVQSMEAIMGKLELFKEGAIKANYAFIPLPNYGGVLCLAQNLELIKTAKYWLSALDVQSEEGGDQIHVYFVQNGLARDIGDILNQVFGLRGGGGAGGRPETQIVGATGRSSFGSGGYGRSSSGFGSGSSFGRSGSSSSRGATSSSTGSTSTLGSSLGGSTTGMGTGSTTGTGQRRAGGVGGGVGTLGGSLGQGFSPASGLTGEVIIIPDEVNNALVIRANAADYAKIKKTLESLDILPRAVLIEVVIIEVTLNNTLQYGVEWLFKTDGFASVFRNATTLNTSGGTDGGTDGTGSFNPRLLAATGLAVFAGDVSSLATLVTLLSSKTDVRVLSAPSLLATDNKEASLTVGGREPIPTSSALGSDTGGTLLTGINYEETGIILNVTPHINAGGLVRMELDQTIRNTGPDRDVGNDATAPSFTERNLKTTLLAHDGSTVVIGGIILDNRNVGSTGIPFLKDIPLLSPLFSTKNKSRDRTELLIAVTPHVIDKKDSAKTREFLDRLRQLRRNLSAGDKGFP
ncbi:MAG: type II secretion system secretin GspD [Syntrophobacteraceae bacterium]